MGDISNTIKSAKKYTKKTNKSTWPGVGGERVLASMRRGAAPFNFSSSIRVGGRLLQKKLYLEVN
jgi:hypothetical protein